MTLGRSKSKINGIEGTSFSPKQKYTYFIWCYRKKPADNVFKKIIDNIKEVNRKYIKPNCKSLFMQQTTQTMSNPCHLWPKRRRYALAANIIGFKLDNQKRNWEKCRLMVSMTHTLTSCR